MRSANILLGANIALMFLKLTQLTKYIVLKDFLAFSGNHELFIDFGEEIHEVSKVFADLSVKLL